jgi:acyl-CoA thioesterase FadM
VDGRAGLGGHRNATARTGQHLFSQTLRFLKPVRLGDRITARVEIVEVSRDRGRVRLATTCVNQDGEPVLTGEAWVRPPEAPAGPSARPRAVSPLWAASALAPLRQSAHLVSFWSGLARSLLEAASGGLRLDRQVAG